jgi:hypothetical protein
MKSDKPWVVVIMGVRTGAEVPGCSEWPKSELISLHNGTGPET